MIRSLGERMPVFEGSEHFVAENAWIIGSVRLKNQASVWFNCVLRGDNDWLEIGERSNIQDGCIVHADPGIPVVVGDGVTVGHNATLHGCKVGDNSVIGIGSTLLNGADIGRDSIVGANSLITENKVFPDGSLILGSPAKVVRALSLEEIAANARSADLYVRKCHRYNKHLSATECGRDSGEDHQPG